MVLREGAETVLILSAVTLNSTELMGFLGTLLGVLCAIAFGVMFVKGSVRINLQKFFRVTTAILFLVAVQLVISGLHELSESGVIPSSKREMAIIGPIVRNDLFFFVTIFALAALMILFDAKRRQPSQRSCFPRRNAVKQPGPPAKSACGWAPVYSFSFVFIALVTAEFIYAKSVSALSPATEIAFTNGQVTIPPSAGFRWRPAPLSGPGKRHARFASGSTRSRMARSPPSLMPARSAERLAFTSLANGVVCKNCAAPINPQSVGSAGGCNPIPLKATQTADSVIIQEADIAAGSRMFEKQ